WVDWPRGRGGHGGSDSSFFLLGRIDADYLGFLHSPPEAVTSSSRWAVWCHQVSWHQGSVPQTGSRRSAATPLSSPMQHSSVASRILSRHKPCAAPALAAYATR